MYFIRMKYYYSIVSPLITRICYLSSNKWDIINDAIQLLYAITPPSFELHIELYETQTAISERKFS